MQYGRLCMWLSQAEFRSQVANHFRGFASEIASTGLLGQEPSGWNHPFSGAGIDILYEKEGGYGLFSGR